MEKGFVKKVWKYPVEKQRATLRADGLSDDDIYEHGKNGEDINECLRAFRNGGTLKIGADFRVFGFTQQAITETVDRIELAHIHVVDLAHPELKTISVQQRHAFKQLAGEARWGKDRKRAARTGKDGGHAKALYAAAKRAERVPDITISRLLWVVENGKVLTWRLLEWALGGKPFSTGTLRRHYESEALPPDPKPKKTRKGRK